MPLKRIKYNSKFISNDDFFFCDLGNTDHYFSTGSFEEMYDNLNLDSEIEKAASEFAASLGLNFNDLVQEDVESRKIFSEITSVVGDDEISTTNSAAMGPVSIVTAPIVTGIRLSRKDCGISKRVGNFAEGWILLPPNGEADYMSVSKRHSSDGVAYVLDVVKLKQLSAVRKQSNLDIDFESKFNRLYETVSWVDTGWFTYDFHQMSILMAMCVFDYRSSRTFPFLFKEEGGIGGLPPYQNLDTAYSGLHTFHRGACKDTILGVMKEATDIQSGSLKPLDSIYLKASHLAQIGGKAWDDFERFYRSVMGRTTKTEADELLRLLRESEDIPSEIKDFGTVIDSEDPLIGVAISHLRSDGLILTDLDVKIMISSQEKFGALKGDVPMKDVLKLIEERNTKIRSNPYLALSRISQVFSETNVFSVVRPENRYQDSLGILKNYYQTKMSGKYQTSFMYSDTMRVYKSLDVMTYLESKTNFLRSDVVNNMLINKRILFNPHIFDKSFQIQKKMKWMESDSLENLIKRPLPDGIGPDDSRIMRNVIRAFETPGDYALVFIIFTSDFRLMENLAILLKREPYRNRSWSLTQIRKDTYIRLCMMNISTPPVRKISGPLGIPMYNYISRKYCYLDSRILTRARTCFSASHIMCLVDFPNYERGLMNLTIQNHKFGVPTVSQTSGGYLRRSSIMNSTINSWPSLPINELSDIPDFNTTATTRWNIRPGADLDLNRISFWFNKTDISEEEENSL